MFVKNLISFLKIYRYWIAASAATGLAAGLSAAFFFNPMVVTYRIKNIGSFFSIEVLKSAKIEAEGMSRNVISQITNQARVQALKSSLSSPGWIVNNITPVFTVTKSDVRDMIDAQVNKRSSEIGEISFINFQANTEDVAFTTENLRWISRYLLNLIQRDKLSRWISLARSNYQNLLADIAKQQPDISLVITANKDRMEAIKNIITTNPSVAKNSQLFLSMNQGQGSNSNSNSNARMPVNNEDLTTFIAPENQLLGLQINQAYLETTLKQLQFKREIFAILADRASEGQSLIDSIDFSIDQEVIDLPKNFWREGKMDHVFKLEKDWRLDYAEGIVKVIEISQRKLRADFEEVYRQGELVEYKRKFSRLIAIIVGLLAGIMAPLVVFALMQISEDEKPQSDNV